MYLFIVSLNHFFILMQFTYMKKMGVTGFTGGAERRARGAIIFERLFLASREARGCSMDVNSFIFVMFEKVDRVDTNVTVNL